MPSEKKGPMAAKGKKTKGKKGKLVQDEATKASNRERFQRMWTLYVRKSAAYLTEPVPAISKCLERMAKSGEPEPKLIVQGVPNYHHTNETQCITAQNMRALLDAISEYFFLQSMYFWHLKVEDKALSLLADFIEARTKPEVMETRKPKLVHLQFVDCKINHIGAGQIGRMVRNLPILQTLVLDHNPIGTDGMILFWSNIRDATQPIQLQTISFRFCEAEDDCSEVIGNSLMSTNCPIRELDLSHNFFKAEGLLSIAQKLDNNKTLESLNLSSNQILEKDLSSTKGSEVSTNVDASGLAHIPSKSHNGHTSSEIMGPLLKSNSITEKQKSASLAPTGNQPLVTRRPGSAFRRSNKVHGDPFSQTALLLQDEDINSSITSVSTKIHTEQSTIILLLCGVLSKNISLKNLNLSGNAIGTPNAKRLYEVLQLRKARVMAKEANPMTIWITEKVSKDVFKDIHTLNTQMMDIAKKSAKGSGKKKKKGKK